MTQVREDLALLAERTHPGMLRHSSLAGEHPTAVGTVVL